MQRRAPKQIGIVGVSDAVRRAAAGQQAQEDGVDIQRFSCESQRLRDNLVEIGGDAAGRELKAFSSSGQHAGGDRAAGDARNLIELGEDAECPSSEILRRCAA